MSPPLSPVAQLAPIDGPRRDSLVRGPNPRWRSRHPAVRGDRSPPQAEIENRRQAHHRHIMKIYSAHGVNEFVVCLGYKATYSRSTSRTTTSRERRHVRYRPEHDRGHHRRAEPGGSRSSIRHRDDDGGRLRRVRSTSVMRRFCLTYGDGVSDVNIRQLLAFTRPTGLWRRSPPCATGALRCAELTRSR